MLEARVVNQEKYEYMQKLNKEELKKSRAEERKQWNDPLHNY